ncbi:MAG: DUF2161 family putative PD-(D/E)XK-type phosphodiesterase [Leptospirales bacterium]
MKESDLYVVLESYYRDQGFEVKGEVCGCDLVALKKKKGDEQLIIIELKKSFNVKLLYQAVRRLAITDQVYVAFLKPEARQKMSFWTMVKSLCRRLHIGAIIIEAKNIRFLAEPSDFQGRKSSAMKHKLMKEFMGREVSENIGGVNRQKIQTAYLESAIYIAALLNGHETLSAKALQEMGAPENTYAILYKNHYGWFSRKAKGLYSLKKGTLTKIQKEYSTIWEHYRLKVDG